MGNPKKSTPGQGDRHRGGRGAREEVEACRRIVGMQRAACAARQGTRRWGLPLRMESDDADA
jgi:hypothetical protein